MRESRIPSHWIATAAGAFAIVLLWLTFSSRSTSGVKPVGNGLHDESWRFIASRDSRNLGLSDVQCDVSIWHRDHRHVAYEWTSASFS